MTPEILKSLEKAATLTELDDIYRPFRPKRQTRATIAEAKGLKPLADIIFAQADNIPLEELATGYIDAEKGVENIEQALAGASDIIAEQISDNAEIRKELREFITETGIIETELKENEKSYIYKMYDNFREEVKTLPSHRILAINRGEKDDCLKVQLKVNTERCLKIIKNKIIKGESIYKEFIENAIIDSFDRLIFPSLERKLRADLTDIANEQAINMFKINLKPLLMQPPLKDKTIMGLDPAYRTGCKLAIIDKNSNVLDKNVIFPTPPHNQIEESEKIVTYLIKKYNVDVISIGNGTASKECEIFVSNLIKKLPKPVSYMVVNEAGASVYSASKFGAEEIS